MATKRTKASAKKSAKLLVRRAIHGPLSDEEEAKLAGDRMEIWEALSATQQRELEIWIEQQVRAPEPSGKGLVDLRDLPTGLRAG